MPSSSQHSRKPTGSIMNQKPPPGFLPPRSMINAQRIRHQRLSSGQSPAYHDAPPIYAYNSFGMPADPNVEYYAVRRTSGLNTPTLKQSEGLPPESRPMGGPYPIGRPPKLPQEHIRSNSQSHHYQQMMQQQQILPHHPLVLQQSPYNPENNWLNSPDDSAMAGSGFLEYPATYVNPSMLPQVPSAPPPPRRFHSRNSSYCSDGGGAAPIGVPPCTSPVILEYLDVGSYMGRAGVLKLFFIVFGIPFKSHPLWEGTHDLSKRKYELLRKNRGAILPQWPAVITPGRSPLVELSASLRFFARSRGLYGGMTDPFLDYLADLTIEKTIYWRDHISIIIGENLDCLDLKEKDDTSLKEYFDKSREKYYILLETILEYSQSTFYLGDTLSWVDPAVFSVIYDDLTLAYVTRNGSRCSEAKNFNQNSFLELITESHASSMLRKHTKLYEFLRACLGACPPLSQFVQTYAQQWLFTQPQNTTTTGSGSGSLSNLTTS